MCAFLRDKKFIFKLLFIHLCLLASFSLYASLSNRIQARGEKVIVVDPRSHQWGAYDERGYLVRSGLASAGSNWCSDIKRPCRTHTGMYRIYTAGDSDCISTRFPLPHGGAPMPYCMYFNGNQALHGSPNVVHGNISHGCVRMRTPDARWLRYNFIEGPNFSNHYRGTLVWIKSY